MNTGVGNTDVPMADHLFLDVPSSAALGIVEIQMQLATADIIHLLSMPVSQSKNHAMNEVCCCEGCPVGINPQWRIHSD
jgi:hypothetical protein